MRNIPENLATVFVGLPAAQILAVAKTIQARLLVDTTLITEKSKKDFVTQADFDIQKLVLEYFAASSLAGTYMLKTEETIPTDLLVRPTNPTWQLIIDPLDGTGAFCKQQATWGVMVGACDQAGQLVYSWNLVSTGGVYSTSTAATQPLAAETRPLERVDVYDYGVTDTLPRFAQQTSYPAAVWAGWQLYNGNLDGLVWLPSSTGKKIYPDYDLIFLGALQAQGWLIRLGQYNRQTVCVAVARTPQYLDTLVAAAKLSVGVEFISDLLITTAL